MDIEGIAIDEIKSVFNKSDFLVCRLDSNDKTPSWDGAIEVYQKRGDVHKKGDLIELIPIQVKGKKLKREPRRKRTNKCSYAIEKADLENYNKRGGTVFFVVHIGPGGICLGRFYAILLPFELQQILSRPGGEKKRSVQLYPLPASQSEIDDLFFNIAEDMRKQSTSKHLNFADVYAGLKGKESFIQCSVGFRTTRKSWRTPYDFLLSNPVMYYADLENGVQVPLFRKMLKRASDWLDEKVTINDEEFYDKVHYSITKEGETVTVGRSFHIHRSNENRGELNFSFELSGRLFEQIQDLRFSTALLQHGKFNLGNLAISTSPRKEEVKKEMLIEQTSLLNDLEELKKALDALDVVEDLDILALSEEDDAELHALVRRILHGEPFNSKRADIQAGIISIAGINILVAVKRNEDDGLFRMYNFNNFTDTIYLCDEKGNEHATNLYLGIPVEFILSASNLRVDKRVNHAISVPYDGERAKHLNLFLLSLLTAFDRTEGQRKDILFAAMQLASWIKENDATSPEFITKLNYYQTITRVRDLTPEEQDEILSLTENGDMPVSGFVGAYILLGYSQLANRYLKKLREEDRKDFLRYPIANLMPDLQRALSE